MFATGIHKVRRDGEEYELPAPKLIDMKIWEKTQTIKQRNKEYPARPVKKNFLLGGIVTYPCGMKWNAYGMFTKQYWTKKSTGGRKEYQSHQSYYRCIRVLTTSEKGWTDPDCPRTKETVRLDQKIWERVSGVLKDPNILLEATRSRREQLKGRHKEASERLKKLEANLESIAIQRQVYVRKFGVDQEKGGPFTKPDLYQVLEELSTEEVQIKREMAEHEILVDTRVDEVDHVVEEYLSDIRIGLEWLDKKPETEEEKDEQFKERRKIIEALVEKVVLRKSQLPEILFRLDLSPLLKI